MSGVWRATRSELVRLRQPRLLLGWAGLALLSAAMTNAVMFSTAAEGTVLPEGAPGVRFPSAAALAAPDGLVAGLAASASVAGVVTLAFWAVVTASDSSTGLVRLLVSAEPHRLRLLAGKVAALALVTGAVALLATAVTVVTAAPAAEAAGVATGAWQVDGSVMRAWLDALAAQLVWGALGLVLAVLTRSAAVATGAGVGYVLVVEPLVTRAAPDAADRLLGATLSALAAGGDATASAGSAGAAALAYVAVGLAVAALVLLRRDVTE